MNQHQQHVRRGHRGFTLLEVMIAVVILAAAISGVLGSIVNLENMRKDGADVQWAHQVGDYVSQALQGTNWDDLNNQTRRGAYLTWARWPDADGTGTIDDDTNCLTDSPNAGMLAPVADTGATYNLADHCRLPFATGLLDLRVYLEYYRAVSATDENGAVLKNGVAFCFAGLLQGSLTRTPDAGGEIWTIDPTLGDPSRLQQALTGQSVTERIGINNRIPAIGVAAADADGDGLIDAIEPIRLPWNSAISTLSGVTIGADDPVAARITVTWRDRSVRPGPNSQRRQLTLITGLKR